MLKWNDLEECWECEDCGAKYGKDEIARFWGFGTQDEENFEGGYCMDCGINFTECEK